MDEGGWGMNYKQEAIKARIYRDRLVESRKRTMNFHLNILSIRNMLKSNSLLFCSRWNQQKRNFPIDKAFARNSINLNFLVNLHTIRINVLNSLEFRALCLITKISSPGRYSFSCFIIISIFSRLFRTCSSVQFHINPNASCWTMGCWKMMNVPSPFRLTCLMFYSLCFGLRPMMKETMWRFSFVRFKTP